MGPCGTVVSPQLRGHPWVPLPWLGAGVLWGVRWPGWLRAAPPPRGTQSLGAVALPNAPGVEGRKLERPEGWCWPPAPAEGPQ